MLLFQKGFQCFNSLFFTLYFNAPKLVLMIMQETTAIIWSGMCPFGISIVQPVTL